MIKLLHYDAEIGKLDIIHVFTSEERPQAECMLAFMVVQDHGTDDVYYLSQETE
jgi:hypothetical protein